MRARRPPLRLLRLANPLVALVLRSPAHGLLDGSLLLLTYRGHRSGRSFTIPVMYARDGERLVVVAAQPERKLWWRSFRAAAAATVRLRGADRAVVGRVLADADREKALTAYLERFSRAAGSVADGVAVVGFDPVDA